jgi:hypothetical protein
MLQETDETIEVAFEDVNVTLTVHEDMESSFQEAIIDALVSSNY